MLKSKSEWQAGQIVYNSRHKLGMILWICEWFIKSQKNAVTHMYNSQSHMNTLMSPR